MKDSRKEFIKKAHSAACIEWKENIEKEFPKLFKEDALVVGKWYRVQDSKNALVFIQGIDRTYGFDYGGIWTEIWNENISNTTYIPATDKEVEEALIKEAKRRGFKGGVKITTTRGNLKTISNKFKIMSSGNLCSCNDSDGYFGTIFKNGVWAEIVETITKEQAEKELGKTILD